ncbi:MAG: sodium-translocating pyrophosphatase [Candidatus Omnitrophica bacterium]|nr:sodium-translocating pyrophosphatase [Candidatus Omnitrophota bacterium]
MNSAFFSPFGALLALCFAAFLWTRIRSQDEGTERMQQIAGWVRDGAYAYLKRQYKVVGIFFGVAFVVLFGLAKGGLLPIFVPFAFLTGGFYSGLAGFIGMSVAVNSSARTASAARTSLNGALRVAFSSGSVMGMCVVGLGLLDLSCWFFFLNHHYANLEPVLRFQNVTSTMLCCSMGASAQAMFARLGGGIYTKAADVGADLVGKVEAGIPEDDPRNPAVIADNVGDNVGDVAGMGADLYESYVGSIVATMALGTVAFMSTGLSMVQISVPMAVASVGVLASIIGNFFVKTSEKADQNTLLKALRRGVFISSLVVAVVAYPVVRMALGPGMTGIYFAILAGLIAGIVIGLSTEYFTSSHYKPTRGIADAAETGPATVVIAGISVGMLSTLIPVLTVGAAILTAFHCAGGGESFSMGLYGVGIAAVGMLSTLGMTLATDAYGPVADNAGGNAEMAHLPPEVRERTDALDALGNTTAATGKGFAIGSAALSAMALIAAFRQEIAFRGVDLQLSLDRPDVLVGLFIGGMLPYLFCAFILKSVGRAAGAIVVEVRRQFREIAGLMEGKEGVEPDHARCVSIATTSAQKEMILPAALAFISPILVGLFLGVNAQVGLLTGVLVSGFVLAVFMANAGGAWDNAKKYIEEGHFGGKGSPSHKAAVSGDTVGDPFKDTAGPAINILIKLMSIVSIVFAGFILKFGFFK